MNYKKQILFSILFALLMAVISYFVFTYLPYDCGNLTQLTYTQRLECRTVEVLGIYYWLPHTTTLFFSSILFYWIVYGVIAGGKFLLERR